MNKLVLGRNVYKARKDRQFTGEKLSELCNINPSYLRAIEAGTKTPSLPLFVELCNKLEVSPAYLLRGVLDKDTDENDMLSELYSRATPSQIKLLTAITEAVLSNTADNNE